MKNADDIRPTAKTPYDEVSTVAAGRKSGGFRTYQRPNCALFSAVKQPGETPPEQASYKLREQGRRLAPMVWFLPSE
ncbi:hypothetical protein [Streptomyces sp. NPDC094468]|uniref:hypothetical protein n=1 Tax=Streptomyces sp. NPDC094468 TaxID=3366066 RepID=UPI0037F1213A